MTEFQSTTPCPDPEILAELAEGKLKRHELPPLLEHLQTCTRCSRAVRGANEELQQQQPSTRAPWWLAVAAILVIALLAVPIVRRLQSTSIEKLVELSPRAARVVEPRLSGGFNHAPWRGPNRADGSAPDTAQLKLFGAAGDLVERATKEPSAATQHDAGVALTVIGKPLDAVDRLRDAAARDASNARTWSDLAAAQYSAALQLDRASLYPEALASADRALQIDPSLAEARFNRALVLEKLGLTAIAREAWQRYLEVDDGSQWAAEAREHIAKLPATTGDASFRRDLPLFERAVGSNDRARIEQLVAQYRQQARTFAEAEHLGLWGEALLRGDAAEASRLRDVARAVGDALVRVNGESLLRDAVASIEGASLAEAHATYRRGRMLYGKQQPSAAEPELRRAASLFAAAKSPMALVARYFAASTRYDQNDVDAAERELAAILDDAPAEYIALRAQVQWQLALCRMSQDDWSGALPLVEEAAAAFQRLGERSNEGFVKTLVADALMCTGRPDQAWNARIESFRILSAEGRGSRLPVSIGGAVRMELRAARFESARALLRLEVATDRAAKNDLLLTNALVREAVLASVLGEPASAEEAVAVAQRIDDDALRARALTDADFARGAVLLPKDPRAAEVLLTRAIDGYARIEKPLFLPECHLLRARTRMRRGDGAAAADDLEQGIAQLERHRIDYPGAVVGTGILDAGRALFREAAALAMQRNDAEAAFAYAERSRAQLGHEHATAAEIRKRLKNSDTAVLEIFASHEQLILFCLTERGLKVARAALSERDRTRLYDAIIRPFETEIASVRHLIIVNDPLLDDVPFGALYDSDSRTHLMERVPVSLALSASSLQPRARVRPRAVVAVGLPSGEAAGSTALPGIASELNDVRSLYPRAIDTAPSPTFHELAATAGADVIHIAGHTERGAGPGESGLRFANREWASWRSIAASRFPPSSTIVLAACETLRRPRSSQTFSLSLGGGFLAAGAGDVIGTLDVIPDGDAHDLFKTIHRELARGARADEAVRVAQLEALASRRAVHWQAVAVLTRHIPIREERNETSWQRSLSTSLESARTSRKTVQESHPIG